MACLVARINYTYPPSPAGSVLSWFSEEESALLQSALFSIQYSYMWRYSNGEELTAEDFDVLSARISNTSLKLMRSTMIGAIIPIATIDIPDNCLLCDGSSYSKADYPDLYNMIDGAYILSGTSFYVPDLRSAFVLGAGLGFAVGDTGGEKEHTLSVAEMPTHSHSTIPHSHTEIVPVATIVNGGLEAPANSAIPSPSSTGLSTVTVNDNGGDMPHNNMPPYHALRYVIIAS